MLVVEEERKRRLFPQNCAPANPPRASPMRVEEDNAPLVQRSRPQLIVDSDKPERPHAQQKAHNARRPSPLSPQARRPVTPPRGKLEVRTMPSVGP